MLFYNTWRSHQGYRVQGRTPAQVIKDATGKKKLPSLDLCTTNPQSSTTEQEAASSENITA